MPRLVFQHNHPYGCKVYRVEGTDLTVWHWRFAGAVDSGDGPRQQVSESWVLRRGENHLGRCYSLAELDELIDQEMPLTEEQLDFIHTDHGPLPELPPFAQGEGE